MAKTILPTPDELRQLLRYDPETGKLFWRERTPEMFRIDSPQSPQARCNRWNRRYAGKEAGCPQPDGYVSVAIGRRPFGAHRLAWCLHYGEWPDALVDHIDGCCANNRIANLRVVSQSVNCRNKRISTANTSGVTGVGWHKATGSWQARIKVRGEYVWARRFDTLEAAAEAISKQRRTMGFTERHGR